MRADLSCIISLWYALRRSVTILLFSSDFFLLSSAISNLSHWYGLDVLLAFGIDENLERYKRLSWVMSLTIQYYSLFFDSIFNDVATHYLAVYVVDDALVTAQRVAEERASRAADELRSYDVARKVLQAGPTTPERQEQLRLREDAARAAVGTRVERSGRRATESFGSLHIRIPLKYPQNSEKNIKILPKF